MAMQPMVPDIFRFVLTATEAKPPSLQYGTAHASDTGHGCSICVAVAYFDTVGKQVTIILPADLAVPAKLEVMVLDDCGRRYAPDESATRALVLTRRARWCLPPAAPPTTLLVLSFGFEEDGQMVFKERHAPPPDGSIPPPAPRGSPVDRSPGNPRGWTPLGDAANLAL